MQLTGHRNAKQKIQYLLKVRRNPFSVQQDPDKINFHFAQVKGENEELKRRNKILEGRLEQAKKKIIFEYCMHADIHPDDAA